ncbi:MAG: hypothetical protein R3A47_07135 [Polyangiales bacterium]
MIEVVQHSPGRDVDAFVQFAHELYKNDSAWIPPLNMEIRDRLNPTKNPFFQHAEVALFTARRDGNVVGRCSAQIDHEHLRIHQDNAGFFGFFETVDHVDVARALMDAAEDWLRKRGMTTMRGPFSLSINEEAGTLVEGFDHPPVIMMPHALPYQGRLIESCGLAPVKDLLAWRYEVEPPPARAERAWQAIEELPEVRFRSINTSKMKEELEVLLAIFNDAWQHNWGFVPATDAEVAKMAKDLKLIIDKDIAFFAEIDGKPVAICVCLPNLNEVTADFGGKLTPKNVAKLLWRLKVNKPKSARLMLLGISTELRHQKRYGALSTAMYAELAKRGIANGYRWAELGWTLEDNKLINLGIQAMRGKVYKRYRIYEKSIPA